MDNWSDGPERNGGRPKFELMGMSAAGLSRVLKRNPPGGLIPAEFTEAT